MARQAYSNERRPRPRRNKRGLTIKDHWPKSKIKKGIQDAAAVTRFLVLSLCANLRQLIAESYGIYFIKYLVS